MNRRALKKFLSLPVNPDESWQGGIVPTADEFPFRPAQIECDDRELADGLSNLLRDSGTTASTYVIADISLILPDSPYSDA